MKSPPPMPTASAIQQAVTDSIEDNTIPCAIVAYLKNYQGKPLTVRHEQGLASIAPDIRIVKRTNTELQWGPHSEWNTLRVGDGIVGVKINTDYIVAENARWFAALEERNKGRREEIEHPEWFAGIVATAEVYRKAKAELDAALGNLKQSVHVVQQLIGYDPNKR